MKHLSFRRARTARSIVAVAALALVVPAGASADIPITSFKAGPVPTYTHPTGLPLTGPPITAQPTFDTTCTYGTPGAPINTSAPDAPLALQTQAGANTDFCVSFRLAPGNAITGEDLNSTLVELPVGTLAEIDNAAKCSVEAFNRESAVQAACPTASQVGTLQAQLELVATPPPSLTFATKDAPGRIYALDTPSDKAALLGVSLMTGVGTTESKFLITVTQQGTPTVGLLNQTDTLARVIAGSPVAIKANALRFWGKASEHGHVNSTFGQATYGFPAANFFRVGTTCQTPQVTKLTVNPYTDVNTASKPTTATSAPYNLTGCENLPFNPTFSANLNGETSPGGHPGLSIHIKSPEGDQDLGATKITLPIGVATDLSRIQNACPVATFNADQCTDATNIGTVKATLSGINPDVVSGVVHMVKIEGKTLPALGFDFNGRLPLRVSGISEIDSVGRIVNTFSDLPSIPQRSLDVELVGGAKGILQLPNTTKCTASAFDAVLTSQNGANKSVAIPTKCAEQLTARLEKADTQKPTLFVGGAGATGKKIQTLRLTLPAGLTINKNKSQSGITVKNLDTGVTGDTKRSRLSKKEIRFTLPSAGSNGLSIITRSKTLGASSKYAKATTSSSLVARIVYTDGSKVNVTVPITRKDS